MKRGRPKKTKTETTTEAQSTTLPTSSIPDTPVLESGGLAAIKEEIKEKSINEEHVETRGRKKKKSKVEIDPVVVASVSSVCSLPFDFSFKRLGLTPLTKEEKETLGKSVAAVFSRYMPELYSNYGELINLTLCMGGILLLRYFEYGEKNPKPIIEQKPQEKKQEPKAESKGAAAKSLEAEYPTFNNDKPRKMPIGKTGDVLL